MTTLDRAEPTHADGIFAPEHRLTTIGLLTAIVACAFDQTAVTAVMPHIAEALGNADAYSMTFVAALAASIIGMVSSGLATDHYGARRSLIASATTLGIGLVTAVIAPDMPTFLASRAIQGLGTGGLIVAIYATIAQAYPPPLRPAVFAAFSGAWVIPSLIGPGIAGTLTVTFTWHSVFLLALAATIAALALLTPALRTLPPPQTTPNPRARTTLSAATALAAATAGMSAATQTPRNLAPIIITGSLIAAIIALKPLTPNGTLRLKRGTPRLIATRGFVDMFFAAEIYLPLILAQRYQLGPKLTGIALTVTGIFWFFSSNYQSRRGADTPTPQIFRIGVTCMAAGTLWVGALTLAGGHWAIAILGWAVTATGMGFVYPRMSSKPLELCEPKDTGFTGSALQVTGTTGTTLMLSLCSLIQVYGPPDMLPAVFVLITAAAIPLLVMWRPAVPEPGR